MRSELIAAPADWLARVAMLARVPRRTAFPGRLRRPFQAVFLPLLLVGLIPTGVCLAQQEPANVPQTNVTVVSPWGTSEYWLGIVSEPVPDALRAHLGLPENQGLLVEQVAPKSPAAAAGLQRHDILLKADGKTLAHVGDLIATVGAAKGKKLNLELIRKGKPMKVDVTPAKRPEGEITGIFPFTPAEAWGKWMEQFRPGDPRHRDYSIFFLRPGVVVARPGGLPDLPGNVTIAITKQGNQPAKVVVTRGDEKWEVTEGKLDALPPDLRAHVEGMLRQSWKGSLAPRGEGRETPPAVAVTPAPRLPKAEIRKSLEKQLEDMNRGLDEMRKAVEELKKQWPPTAPDAKGDKQ